MIQPGESSPAEPVLSSEAAVPTMPLPAELSSMTPEPPVITESPSDQIDLQAARRWQLAADALTATRLAGSLVLARQVAKSQFPPLSWTATLAGALIAGTDYVDGWCARKAHQRGGPKRLTGAYADQLTDKVLTNGLQLALASANGHQGDVRTQRLMQAVTAVTLSRDAGVTALRLATDVTKVPVNTAARPAGKFKAAVQYVGLLGAISPLTRNKALKAAISGVVVASAYLSAKSGVAYARLYTTALREGPGLAATED